jgi:hypothetical protein
VCSVMVMTVIAGAAVGESLAGESFDEFGEGGVGDGVEVVSALQDGVDDFGHGDVGLEVPMQAPDDAGRGHRSLTGWVCREVAHGVGVHGWLDRDGGPPREFRTCN